MEQVSSEEITLKEIILKTADWISYFKTKAKWIVISTFLTALIGGSIAYFDKTTYTAELTLAQEEKGGASGYAGLASQLGLELGGGNGGAFVGENNIELMKSRNIIEKSLLTSVNIDGKQVLLVNRYIEFNKYREFWIKNNPDLAAVEFKANEDRSTFGITKDSILYSIYKDIKKNSLTVEKIDKKLSIIKVRMTSRDEIFAKHFTEVLVNAASDLYIQTKTQNSRKNLDILESRLDSVKKQLDYNIYAAASSKDQNNNVIRAKGNISFSQKQLNVQVLTTMYGELIKNTEIAKYTLMREEPLIQVIDKPILPLEKTRKGILKNTIGGGVLGFVLTLLVLTGIRLKEVMLS